MLRDVNGHLKFKVVYFYYRKLKLHRENTGKTQEVLFLRMSGNHVIKCLNEYLVSDKCVVNVCLMSV